LSSAPATNGHFWLEVKHQDFPKASFLNDGDDHRPAEGDSLKLADLHAGNALLVLKSGPSVRGVVMDEQQNPVAGAKVSYGEFFSSANPNATTSNDGSFVLRNLPAGKGHVTIVAQGFAP